jgi:glycosyltransferase involved in cell wall biosynthesis
MLTGVVAWFCRRNRRKSVYAAASDIDFLPGKQQIEYRRDRWLFEYGVQNVDAIVVQNQRQYADCREHYGRDATLIPSCSTEAVAPRNPEEILWVGTIRSYKRPELFIDLARGLPQLRFTMVGGPGGSDAASMNYFREIEAVAKSVPNLKFCGFVPYAEVDAFFDRASIFVNTSLYEGFPNTFLQSWARGVPVVSYFDTGSKFEGQAVVCRVCSQQEAASAVCTLKSDAGAWRYASERSRRHFENEHSLGSAVSRYVQLFSQLGSGPASA